jgi:hypothetical protein
VGANVDDEQPGGCRQVLRAYALVRDVRVLGCGCCGKPRSIKLSKVAVKYSASKRSMLLKLSTTDFRARGVDLRFVSTFPGEAECLYPPLTHLRPVTPHAVEVHQTESGATFAVIEVVPSFG